MCRHLTDPETEDDEHIRVLTGNGTDADYLCRVCEDLAAPDLVSACEGCFDRHVWNCVGWRGRAGIAERPEPIDTRLVFDDLPPVVDAAPYDSGWMLLLPDGVIARFAEGAFTPVGVCDLPAPPLLEPHLSDARFERHHLHCSPDGRIAAVAHDHGRQAQIIDLESGAARTVDGGDYRFETVPFSLAFVDDERLVVRTNWNRLVVLDARTGEETASTDEELDFFHGALHLSPAGRWIADDGWVWAPTGRVRVWSSDLRSHRDLCDRDYLWDVPMCWLGDDLFAVSGIGDDGIAMLPGVRVFDVPTATELLAFPLATAPHALFAAGRRLYAATDDGLDVHDPFTGERTGSVAGFQPRWHHRAAGELAGLTDGRLARWRL